MNDGKEFVIRHREYITDIYSGVAGAPGAPAPSPFKIQSFSLNPGMIETYPWLANVAGRFEEYNIEVCCLSTSLCTLMPQFRLAALLVV